MEQDSVCNTKPVRKLYFCCQVEVSTQKEQKQPERFCKKQAFCFNHRGDVRKLRTTENRFVAPRTRGLE